MQYREIDWYDVPRYYDLIFSEGTEEEADFLEAMHRLYGRSSGKRMLEPGCGSGRLVAEMARRGYTVTGLDLSEPMLDFARTRLERDKLSAVLRRGDMAKFRIRGKCDIAHCLVSTFKYLLDEESARSHLESVRDALREGGIYILGFHLSDYDSRSRVRERWTANQDGLDVRCNIQAWPPDRKTRIERVRSRLVVEERGKTMRSETHWDFRTYDARQVRELLASVSGLKHIATYDMTYELGRKRRFDDEQLDNVLVLRRTS